MQPGLVQVPVFVYPTPITFYLEDQTSHKQVLTLYNPYEFAIRFRVLCTAPNKYTVVDPEGFIRPRCCIDIVVRHNAVYPGNCNVTDKFRVEMQNHATKQVIGKQVVTATLLPGKPSGTAPDPDVFQNLPQHMDAAGATSSVQHQFGLARDYRQNSEPRGDSNSSRVYWSTVAANARGTGFKVPVLFTSDSALEAGVCICSGGEDCLSLNPVLPDSRQEKYIMMYCTLWSRVLLGVPEEPAPHTSKRGSDCTLA